MDDAAEQRRVRIARRQHVDVAHAVEERQQPCLRPQQRCNGLEGLGERRLLAGEQDGIGRRCKHGAGGNDSDRRREVPERALHDEAMRLESRGASVTREKRNIGAARDEPRTEIAADASRS